MRSFNYKKAQSSPWGKIDRVVKYTRGLSFVSTPGHGGLRVGKAWLKKHASNPDKIVKLGAFEQGNYYWFEEDCAFQLVMVDSKFARQAYCAQNDRTPSAVYDDAFQSVMRWFPKYFEPQIQIIHIKG